MKLYVLVLMALGLAACGKPSSGNKSPASSVVVGHADATLVYFAMPG